MVCQTCGKPLTSGDKFCQYCGTPVPAQAAEPVSSTPVWETPQTNPYASYTQPVPPSGKKLSLPLILGGAAGALALIVLVIILVINGSPKAKVMNAFESTGKELSQIGEALNMDDLSELLQKDALSMDMDLRIDFFEESPALEDFGITVQTDVNMKKHHVGLRAVPYYGSVELLNMAMAMEEEMIYLGVPELLPDPFYGISTMTLMKDLDNLGADVGEFDQVSFNIFEVIEAVQAKSEEMTKETQKAMAEATKALTKAIEVEKVGSETIEVNDKNTKCTLYTMTIPQNALEDWLDAYADAFNPEAAMEIAEILCQSMNMPSSVTDQLEYSLDGADMEIDLDPLYDVLDELGDLEFDVYVSGGKIAALHYELEIDRDELEINLYLGGDKNYADNLTLEFIVDGDEAITITSSGNHTGKGGTFEDETKIVAGGSKLVLSTEYNTKTGALEFSMKFDRMKLLSLEGTFKADSKSMDLNLEEFNVYDSYYNEKIMSLGIHWTIFDYEQRVQPKDAVLLSSLDEDDLMDIAVEVEEKAQDWLYDLIDEIPELMYIFY